MISINYSHHCSYRILNKQPRATRFLCGLSGYVYISWDITPFDIKTDAPDNYVVMGAYGSWCNDPLRKYPDSYSPTRKLQHYWHLFNQTLLPICISSEQGDDNRCYINSAELFVEYGHGPGCILIYCDNMWDPCMLNMKISIDPSYVIHIL